MKLTKWSILSLLVMALLVGCNNHNQAREELIEDTIDIPSVATPRYATRLDSLMATRKPSFWLIIDSAIYEWATGEEHTADGVSAVRVAVQKIGLDSGWTKPYLSRIEKGRKQHIADLMEEKDWGNPFTSGVRGTAILLIMDYINQEKMVALQQSFDMDSIGIHIADDYEFMHGYEKAVSGYLDREERVCGWYSGIADAYFEASYNHYEMMYKLLQHYEKMGQVRRYQSITNGQFNKAFDKLCKHDGGKLRKEGRKIQQAVNSWMDYRDSVSTQLPDEIKSAYDNATYMLQYNVLIEIKNQFANYGPCSDEVIGVALAKDCTYRQLLSYEGFDTEWEKYIASLQ